MDIKFRHIPRSEENFIQQRVGQWADKTFGPEIGLTRIWRIIQEMDEAYGAAQDLIEQGVLTPPLEYALRKEIADVVVTIMAAYHHRGWDILSDVVQVQAQNEERKWKTNGDGTGQHVKEEEC
jgi:hypothetical protein